MDYYTDYDMDGIFAGLGIFAMFMVVFFLAILVVGIVANWKMFKKAGKGGWECIVPVYGYWVLAEIAGLNWWWFLLAISDSIVTMIGLEDLSFIANLASLVASFNIYYNIAKKFNKSNGTAVCAGIFSFIFIFIFGFSKNEVYNASIPVSKNGIFGTPEGNFNNNVNNQSTAVNESTTSVDTSGQESDVISTDNVDSNDKPEVSFCGNCGTKLNKDIRFCPECGKENI